MKGVLRRDFITEPFQAVLVDNVYRVLKYDLYINRIFKKRYNQIKKIVPNQHYNESFTHYSLYNSYLTDLSENKVHLPSTTYRKDEPIYNTQTRGNRRGTGNKEYNSAEYKAIWFNKQDEFSSKYNSVIHQCYEQISEYKTMYRQHHILYCLLRGVPLYKIDNTYKYKNASRIDFDPIDYILELVKFRIVNINDPIHEI